MSVVINNISRHGDLRGLNQYEVRINNDLVIARFSHVRSEGLAACLRKAADAVAAVEKEAA
ncbi:hypothetical protein [Neorhizobium sp. JUb45]|uniref:hypothetical protein n=1 Tax=Neorhizobium sp. JUb45 TaxID=2485113 RepID=UPI00104D577D|nr:hypothetical protein [Neorhizobium sp. JUb45]TCR07297.1 hypothetical protein EDF70_1011270 [Neorhizobium sp. JUb45]